MTTQQYEFFGDDPQFPTLLITFTLLIGAFFGYLNETLLNVAISNLMQEFAVDKTTVQWITTGFLLVMGALTPLTANVIQWFNTRTMLLITLTVFILGTLICATANYFYLLLIGRLIQAISAAFTVPILFNTVLLIYSPQRRGTVLGIITMMFMIAPAIGPTLSGIIIDHFGWRYLFWFTIPFMLLSIGLTLRYLTINLYHISRPHIDCLSALLSILGLGGFVYTTSNFARLSISTFMTILTLSIGAIIWFIRRQAKLAVPLIDLNVFKIAQYRYAMIILALLMFIFIGAELIVPIYLQQVVLLSATVTGLILLPGSVFQILLSPIMGNRFDRNGARPIVIPGTLLITSSFVLMFFYFEINSTPLLLSSIFVLLSIAVSMILVSETHGLNALDKKMYPHGTAIISTINPIAGAVGAAFFIGITQIGEELYSISPNQTERLSQLATLQGIKLSFVSAILIGIMMFYFATRLRKITLS